MGKFCCFFDPERDYTEKSLDDKCPKCGRPYGYILTNKPTEIVNGQRVYTVLEAIGRGFYGATYLCEVQKRFRKELVLLKVTPVNLYTYFGKNFEEECNKHAEVAENTEHLVKIEDAFDTVVTFGTDELNCHVAELQYIRGEVLSDYIEDPNHNQTKVFAQIAIDLLKLWHELVLKGEFHNDLHLGNLIVEQLGNSMQRIDAIYDKIRLVAIDLNSVADESLSNSEGSRIGDRQYIANHISLLSQKIRSKYKSIDEISDTDFRLIETLNKISRILTIPAPVGDIPEISELVEMIKEEFKSNISYAPWKKTFTLTKLNDGINAQTLPSCYVPELLVDPENKWINEISVSGPQLITGMRGCGKTMLLAALDVHARLMVPTSDSTVYNSLKSDRYIGIMASCRDLVELQEIGSQGISKLILLYSVQIIRAARHIKDIDPNCVVKDYHLNLANTLKTIFDIVFDEKVLYSDTLFERYISDLSNRINEFCGTYTLHVSCITAFELLADALTASSDILFEKQVYFLLDDASTRYLSVEKISELLTKILFMSPKCAFKVTTELQTLYSFKSPGNIEMAHDIRDYQIFDLGADVFKRTRDPKAGKKFVESIIAKRLEACVGTQDTIRSLIGVLDDCPLIHLANFIIENTSSKARKSVYYGATALTALCVGDIGDIIFLYESIISNNESGDYPVKHSIQTQCFQQLCSRRMYNLDRKDGTLKEYVKSFSEASYKCLMDSKKAITKNGTPSNKIRQYNSLYIRMTSGNLQKQQEKVRRLIDSGIFVFADGNGWPRSKSSDTDPSTQIKLAFRKLFGVSNFIPLGNSDRYELSGDALEQWLEKPTKDLLLRNLGNYDDETTDETAENILKEKVTEEQERLEEIVGDNYQFSVYDFEKEETNGSMKAEAQRTLSVDISKRAQIITHQKPLAGKNFDVGIFGLGFEERCLESVRRIVSNNSFTNIILIQYDEDGFKNEILEVVSSTSNILHIKFNELGKIIEAIKMSGSVLIDMSGLYKPIIFDVIRKSLILGKKITVAYTAAQEYYPLNSEIQKIKESIGSDLLLDDATKFQELMKGLYTGDKGPYSNMKLLGNENYDPIRPTALVGFVSPKNQRIFSILDKTEYDAVHLYTPNGKTARDVLSRTAGTIAITNYSSVKLKEFDTINPRKVLAELSKSYTELYIDQNYNFEISLTGSKMQAFAAAVFSSVCKVAQCWYVEPSKFDTNHFTKGVADTKWYTVKIPKY